MEDREALRVASKLQEVGGALRIQGRELPGHGAAWVHRDSAQKVFMRWLLARFNGHLSYDLLGTRAAQPQRATHFGSVSPRSNTDSQLLHGCLSQDRPQMRNPGG